MFFIMCPCHFTNGLIFTQRIVNMFWNQVMEIRGGKVDAVSLPVCCLECPSFVMHPSAKGVPDVGI